MLLSWWVGEGGRGARVEHSRYVIALSRAFLASRKMYDIVV